MLDESTGRDLLDEMKTENLKPFNVHGMNRVQLELKELDTRISELKEEAENNEVTTALSINFAVNKAYKERLVRIEQAYIYSRFRKIQSDYFEKKNIKKALTIPETEFQSQFSTICDKYFEIYSHLNLHDRTPPLDLYVQILTMQDCGMILSDNEMVELKGNRIYYLKKRDVMHLINQNKARVI